MTIRVGVIGTGIIGADHARLLGGVIRGAAVGSVFDLDADRASAVASPLAATVAIDPSSLIADPDIDAVLIASSDETHERFVLDCLSEGKPVLCEKPLTPTVEGCRRIVDAERATGRRLVTVGFMRRHDPGYLEMRRALHAKRIGAALLLHCVHRNPTGPPGQSTASLITGSAIHEIDLARWLLDDEITAATVHVPRRTSQASGATQDPLFLVLQTSRGVIVDVEVFVNAGYGYDVRTELVGEQGTISVDAAAPTVLRQDQAASRALAPDWRPRFAEAYRRELQDWVDALAAGRDPLSASGRDGYLATLVAQAAVVALETGNTTKVEIPASGGG